MAAQWLLLLLVLPLAVIGTVFDEQTGLFDLDFDFEGDSLSSTILSTMEHTEDLVITGRDQLLGRQLQCTSAGYTACPNSYYCCPVGYDCISGGCCPSGQVPCEYNPRGCYDASLYVCCRVGLHTCKIGSECCGVDQCCPTAVGYCGSDGRCSAKPCEVTSTISQIETTSTIIISTRRQTVTVFDAEEEGGPQMPEFVCNATTFTQSRNSASLELGDDCKLTLHVDLGDDSLTPMLARALDSSPTAAPALIPRQAIVCTGTLRGTTTITSTSWTTTNVTVTEAPSALPEFSCPAIVVTNSAGDELALGDDCSLEFTPAEETSADAEEDLTSDGENITAAGPSSTMDLDGEQTSSGSAAAATESTSDGVKSHFTLGWGFTVFLLLYLIR